MKFFVITLFSAALFLSNGCFAQEQTEGGKNGFDYKWTLLGRYYAPGFFSRFDVGFGQKLWEAKGKKKKYLYGFIRPSVAVQTSGLVNSLRGELSLYPVSFIRLYAGYDHTWRETENIPTFNCENEVCDGTVSRRYIGAKMAMAYKGYFLTFHYQLIRNQFQNANELRPFVDERTTLLVADEKSYVQALELFLGYNINAKWSSGVLGVLNQIRGEKAYTAMLMPFARYQWSKKWAVVFASGVFRSRFKSDHPSGLALIEWTGRKGLKLF